MRRSKGGKHDVHLSLKVMPSTFPELLCRPLIQRVNIGEWFVSGFSDIAVLGYLRLSGEVRSAKDGFDLTRRFSHILVIAWPGSSITNIIPEVPGRDELLDLVFEHDVLLCGVADILVISAVLVLVSFGVVS